MTDENGVSVWIDGLRDGDSVAVNAIWEQYFPKLVRYARRKIENMPRRIFDEEDVALSAMRSFFQGMEDGEFSKVDDRQDLWKLLVTITARKAHAQRRKSLRGKRGGGNVRGESVFTPGHSGSDPGWGIGDVLGEDPTPEMAAMVMENVDRLLEGLQDETLREVALMKLEGFTNEEVADKLGCVRRTVERKLERIRDIWSEAEQA
jgi:DNA-directed RNA polymerase specialized sigma24 family protein